MEPDWAGYTDEQLLRLRFCDLGLEVEGTEVQDQALRLYRELEAQGLRLFRPRVYFGDEWFSPEGVPAISIPFYLGHPRLTKLEKSQMLEAEGEAPEDCMKLLRHEAGHCFDHAYQVSRRKKWREIFGSPREPYDPDAFRPRPYSRNFVRNLGNWYAQAHPDEDFAETFAVWLNPRSDWGQAYGRWPGALRKLCFVDKLGQELGKKEPVVKSGHYRMACTSRMRTTLGAYYVRKRRTRAQDYPDFYDHDLIKIFGQTGGETAAWDFMRNNRVRIVNSVSYWTREGKHPVDRLVRKLTARCRSLDLRMGRRENETYLEISAFLATLVTHYRHTGKFKRSF